MHPDDRDFHYSTDAEWDRAEARELGALHPERTWILTDRDVFHANPFYKGPPVPHPELDDVSNEEEAIAEEMRDKIERRSADIKRRLDNDDYVDTFEEADRRWKYNKDDNQRR